MTKEECQLALDIIIDGFERFNGDDLDENLNTLQQLINEHFEETEIEHPKK